MQPLKKESVTTQIHEIYIKSTPEAIWNALTTPEWTAKYGYRSPQEYDLKPGGKYRVKATEQMRAMGLPEVIIDGEVLESRPPHKLVHTVRFLFSEENKAEGFTRITWEIEPQGPGFCRLTVIHELEGAPLMASATASKFNGQGGGGWTWIISDLKSLLETGKSLKDDVATAGR
jgi:uncharacterized protein YndB with AHSA1/START domain